MKFEIALNTPNENGRIYTTKVARKCISKAKYVKHAIKNRVLFIFRNYMFPPNCGMLDPIGVVNKIIVRKNKMIIHYETFDGEELSKISLNGYGTVDCIDGVEYVCDDYRLYGFIGKGE